MASNRGLAYMGPGMVEVQGIDYPKLALGDRKCEHGVILKIVSTNICGSDQHMVRGRTTAPKGLILGHEITGEVIARRGGTWNSSRLATWSLFRSISPAGVAATARSATRASV
jgi:threonine dehydrogenase-like Zn-dependent dehydrogenase